MFYCRILILTHIFYFVACSNLFAQMYPVNARTANASFINERFREIKVEPFIISKLITVREFKEYLKEVKRDSSENFYQSQLPSSNSINEELVEGILSSEELQNKPMPGVSWVVARNYCTWLSKKLNLEEIEFDLPFVSELIAFNELYKDSLNSELASWTLNSYDESILEFSGFLDLAYSFDAGDDDPPVMKRKVIFGESYHMNYDNSSSFRPFQYEYQDSSSRYVGFRVVRRFKENTLKSFKSDKVSIYCREINNHLDGLYQEKYIDGSLKVLGTFSNNQRVGVWSVWDEQGILKIQRAYKNNKQCDFLFPVKNNPYKDIYMKYPYYTLQRNSNQIYPYLYVEERSVVYSQRVWRGLTVKNESELFQNIDFKLLTEKLFENKVNWYYYGKHGTFKTEISNDSISYLETSANSWDFSRIEVKEDFFFNIDNLLSDTRQIAISFYKDVEDKKPTYMVYFPRVRSVLSDFKIESSSIEEIQNLDDIFFFHAYRGKIAHISDPYHYKALDSLDQNELKLELEKFSSEHDLWLEYGR